MKHILAEQELWKHGTFLHERVVSKSEAADTLEPAVLEEAEQRLQVWQESMLIDDDVFEERWALVGLSREAFLQVLADVGVTVISKDVLAWSSFIDQMVSGEYAQEPLPQLTTINPVNPGEGPKPVPFQGFLRPFLQMGIGCLRAGVSTIRGRYHLKKSPLDDKAETELLRGLAQRLLFRCTGTLVLELNVARMLNKLPGSTTKDRFDYFSESFFEQKDNLLGLLQEYPVLARLMVTTAERWVEVTLEFLERLVADRHLISQTFFSSRDVGILTSARIGFSDPHRGGRGVVQVKFSSGLQLIYKPRPLAVEHRFQNLLRWLNEAGLRFSQRVITVVDRGSYGWVEFVEAAGCETRQEVERFYWRQGSYLALLYLLRAVDLHLENLIASGEHPVLVDLEALFHHEIPSAYGEKAYEQAMKLLDQSVLRIGLLPMRVLGKNGRRGVDLSGLGGEEGQLLPRPVPMMEDAYTDIMHVVRRQVKMPGAKNRPLLQDQRVDTTEFAEKVVSGFRETYAFLMHHRDALAKRLEAFADVEVRHIVRATQRYALFLQEGSHPDYLRDGLDRNMLLDKLWAETVARPHLRRLVFSEQADLRLGDIPFFTTRPAHRHIWDSRGECIQDFFAKDSLSEVLERLFKLSEEDCTEQTSLVHKAMITIDKTQHLSYVQRRAPDADYQCTHVSPDDFLAGAVSVGEYLQSKAIRGKTDVCWIGVNLEGIEHWYWALSPIETNVYDGVGGVALFFSYLAAATGRSDFQELARAALEAVASHLRMSDPEGYSNIGAFTGRASNIYVLSHLSVLWNEPTLIEEALAGLAEMEKQIPLDKNLDILGGAAGCIVVLLDLYKRTHEPRALAAARRCGERLLETAKPRGSGWGWVVAAASDALAGFSHGSAGIVWSLLELAAATDDERYRDAAYQGLAYERDLFVPDIGNWLDLRKFNDDSPSGSYPTAWCHGAPSVALGRLLALRHLKDPVIHDEITTGIETTLRQGFGGSHCLCHGDLGNSDILHFAGEVMGKQQWQQTALDYGATVLREVQAGRWRCGLPRYTETPGLMTGLAGIGFGLLRLWSPLDVPSILRLEPAPTHIGTLRLS
ncbi:MAG: type 2 lanthipeptide synthetase LanM family protein [Chloroflexota bacterium]|nr:type 2 lanthipeptide synthetase LanM family protein [Chloroflexota bacterium]